MLPNLPREGWGEGARGEGDVYHVHSNGWRLTADQVSMLAV